MKGPEALRFRRGASETNGGGLVGCLLFTRAMFGCVATCSTERLSRVNSHVYDCDRFDVLQTSRVRFAGSSTTDPKVADCQETETKMEALTDERSTD